MSIEINNISGKLLIAVPGLDDPNFSRTVLVICEHSREGAFGLIINRILMNSFSPLLSAFEIKRSVVDFPVHFGGPVRPEQGYVLYSPADEKYMSMKVDDTIAVSASKEILCDIAEGRGPQRFLFALGFSGWTSNQLEDELMTDSWLVAPLDNDIIFNVPAGGRWRRAACSIGVDLDRFCNRSGSA